MKNLRDYRELKKELLKNKEIRKAYDELGPQYDLISSVIRKRLEQGLTQADLAQKVGTKQSAISRFESGAYNPSMLFMGKVAQALGTRVKIKLEVIK